MRTPLERRRTVVIRFFSSAALHVIGMTLAAPHDAAARDLAAQGPAVRACPIPHLSRTEHTP